MPHTEFPDHSDPEEKPRAMLFDGWGYVPMPEPVEAKPEAKTKKKSAAA